MSPIQLIPIAANVLAPAAGAAIRRVVESFPFPTLGMGERSEDSASTRGSSDQSQDIDELQPRPTEHLERLMQSELRRLLSDLRATLAAHEIDASQQFAMKSGPSGRIQVDGNHPQRAQIEAALEDHPTIPDTFRRLAAAATSVRRERHGETLGRDLRLVWNNSQSASIEVD